MAPKFATIGVSDPADSQNFSKSQHGGGSFYIFKWQNAHGLHGSVSATNWVIWIGQNAGGGEKYKTKIPIPDTGTAVVSDPGVSDAALPIGTSWWVTPKYQRSDGTWNDGHSTKFNVVA